MGEDGFSAGRMRSKRFVTVLCSDLSGFTRLSEFLDCEDLGSFIARLMAEAGGIIGEFGGVVEKYVGDAVVALFGMERTREDDPLRAVLAALRIHKAVAARSARMPFDLAMHSGLHAGEVIVDVGAASQTSTGALGMPITIACRLCDMAGPGEILVSGGLAPEVSRFFRLEWLGMRAIAGFTKCVHVYRVLARKEEAVLLHRESGLTAPMVGRDRELGILLARFRSVAQAGSNVLCIRGDAGAGKSRLVREFRRALGEEAVFLAAACQDHTRSIPYSALRGLVASVVSSLELGGWRKDEVRSLQDMACDVETLLARAGTGSHAEGPAMRERITDALSALFRRIASLRPVVVCVEDIHWADKGTLDYLSCLAHDGASSGLRLVVLTHRPSFLPEFRCLDVALRDLCAGDVEHMISCMLGGYRVEGGCLEWMMRVSGGNPLFVEEIVNYLVEKGGSVPQVKGDNTPDGIPVTLQGLITSRIDHLDPAPRRVLQEASLLGRTFSGHVLSLASACANANDELERLAGYGLLETDDGENYTFRHEIIREVASHTLLKEERRYIHQRIVEAAERLFPEPTNSSIDMLARHCLKAGQFAKAVRYQMEAARRCFASGAWFEAAAWYEEAIYVLETHIETQWRDEALQRAYEGIWNCCRVFDPPKATSALERLAAAYRGSSRHREAAFAYLRLVNLYSQQGRFRDAFDAHDKACTLMGDDPVMKAAASTVIAYTHTFLGEHDEALALLDSSRSVLEGKDRFLLAVNALSTLAASVWKGELDSAFGYYTKTKELGGDHLDIDLMADMWLYHILCLSGRFLEAVTLHESVSARERKLGRIAGGLSYLSIQGSVYFKSRYLGDIEGAREALALFGSLGGAIAGGGALEDLYRAWIALEEGSARLARDLAGRALGVLETGFRNRVPYALTTLAEARLALGDLEGAAEAARTCVERLGRGGNREQLSWALRILAEALMRLGDGGKASIVLDTAEGIARDTRMMPQLAWIMAARGNLAHLRGMHEDAAVLHAWAAALWEHMGNGYQAKRVHSTGHPSPAQPL